MASQLIAHVAAWYIPTGQPLVNDMDGLTIDGAYRLEAQRMHSELERRARGQPLCVEIDIRPVKNKRTLDQNRLMWALLNRLALALSGDTPGGVTAEQCYLDLLAEFGAEVETWRVPVKALPALRNTYRVVQKVELLDNGYCMARLGLGSSSFDRQQMLKANRTILMDNGPRQFHLRDALKCVAGDYDYCIMDCPPDLDMGSINALCAADWVIIPVDCDKWACDGMQEIVEQIEQVQAYYNPRLKIMGALMTKYRRTRYAEDIIVQLCASGISVLETVIRYTVKVSEAAHAGMPLLEYCPDCTAAVDYRELTEEVERIVSNVDTKEG